jgi:DNA-binding response OmpR family regulator
MTARRGGRYTVAGMGVATGGGTGATGGPAEFGALRAAGALAAAGRVAAAGGAGAAAGTTSGNLAKATSGTAGVAVAAAATATGQSVLVVEDDPGIAGSLVRGLERAGYRARAVRTGAQALAAEPTDVVLLDLGLPDADGFEICRRLAARATGAILVVTARGEEGDRVAALDEGADDYLVKPFGLAELLARIRAVLRRIQPATAPSVVHHGPLSVDSRTRKVTVHGEEVALTPREFEILECLAADPGRVFTRQALLERIWDAHWYGPTKVLDVHVAALRKKLAVPGLIETAYGRGFRLADPEPEPPTTPPSPAAPSPPSPPPPAAR